QKLVTAPLLRFYTRILPPLSDTERVALEAGTVGFEGELFSGRPKWDVLLSQPKPVLTAEEQAFLQGPCEEVCKTTNDWETTYDPDGLLGDEKDRGITLALVPRGTPGMDIGRRHFPLNCVFQNGPIHGKDVFLPLSQLIGGEDYIGHGWRMLVECLSVGRSITL